MGILCFHLSQDIFKISISISFSTHWLFMSILFNFHIFLNFPVFLLLLISGFIPLWMGKILGSISVLNLRPVLGPTVRSECVFYSAAVGWNVLYLICLLGPFGLWCLSSLSFQIFCLDVLYWLLKMGYWSHGIAIYVFLHFCQWFLYIFRCSDVGYIYIYNCYSLLVDWPFYHCLLWQFLT